MTYREEIIGPCRLILGDCRVILLQLGRVDAVVTDPPYGIAFCKGSGGKGMSRIRNAAPIFGDDADFDPGPWLSYPHVILWGANHFAARLPHGRWLAWDKLAGVPEFDSFSDVEFAWCKGRGKDRIFNHLWKGVIKESEKTAGKAQERWHPTQKPVALMRWCIEQLPETCDVILDPYMGSGSTGVACVKLGRRFIGIEIESKYFEIAIRRIESAVRQPDLFIKQPEPRAVQEELPL